MHFGVCEVLLARPEQHCSAVVGQLEVKPPIVHEKRISPLEIQGKYNIQAAGGSCHADRHDGPERKVARINLKSPGGPCCSRYEGVPPPFFSIRTNAFDHGDVEWVPETTSGSHPIRLHFGNAGSHTGYLRIRIPRAGICKQQNFQSMVRCHKFDILFGASRIKRISAQNWLVGGFRC